MSDPSVNMLKLVSLEQLMDMRDAKINQISEECERLMKVKDEIKIRIEATEQAERKS